MSINRPPRQEATIQDQWVGGTLEAKPERGCHTPSLMPSDPSSPQNAAHPTPLPNGEEPGTTASGP